MPAAGEAELLGRLRPTFGELVERVRLHAGTPARVFVRCCGAQAVTLGRRVFLSRAAHEQIARRGSEAIRLLTHELTHAEQFRREGVFRFLSRYLWEYLQGRRTGMPHAEAYRAISYEREARQREDSVSALMPVGRDVPEHGAVSGEKPPDRRKA